MPSISMLDLKLSRRVRLALGIISAILLGVFWFYVLLSPWRSYLNSDHAIPYAMTIESWRPQDLYYWGTSRMGQLYEVLWKAATLHDLGVRSSLAGSELNTEFFYLFHLLLYFIGIAFFFATFDTLIAGLLFVLLALPLSQKAVYMFLLPGQPYGVIFAMISVFLFALIRMERKPVRAVLLGLTVGALWIQHELSGMIALVTYLFSLERKSLAKIELPFWFSFVPMVALAYPFKYFSEQWSVGSHYDIAKGSAIYINLIHFLNHGLQVPETSWVGHPLFILLVGSFIFLLFKSRKEKLLPIEKTLLGTFFGCFLAVLLVNLSRWFILNDRNPRYYLNLIPLIFWGLLKLFETERTFRLRWIIPLFLCIALADIQKPSTWIHQSDAQLPPSGICAQDRDGLMTYSCGVERLQAAERKIDLLERQGCLGYLDDYWNSHLLTALSNGTLQASAFGYMRNPALYGEIISSPRFCSDEKLSPFILRGAFPAYRCNLLPEHIFVCNRL